MNFMNLLVCFIVRNVLGNFLSCSYELIFHAHIDEKLTDFFYFIKKKKYQGN